MSFSRRMATLPWPAYVLLVLVAGAATLGLLAFVYSDLYDDPNLRYLGAGVFAVTAVVSPVVAGVQRRRLRAEGRWEARLDAVDAFEQRRAPTHPAVWSEFAEVARKNRAMLGTVRRGWILFGLLAVGSALTAFAEPRRWIMVALFGAVAAAYPRLHRRIRGQVEAADRALGAAAPRWSGSARSPG